MDISHLFTYKEVPAIGTEEILIYEMMSKDKVLLRIDGSEVEVVNRKLLPVELLAHPRLRFHHFRSWVENRAMEIHRGHAKSLLNYIGVSHHDKFEQVMSVKALSLTDCYWVRTNKKDNWDSVNLFYNGFSEDIADVAFRGYSDNELDPYFRTPEITTQGDCTKCWVKEGEDIYLYKFGTEDGFECEAEFVVSKLLEVLGVKHVHYELVEYKGRRATRCKNMATTQNSIMPIAHFMSAMSVSNSINRHTRTEIDPLQYVSNKFGKDYHSMNVVDWLIDNKDRHAYNWGLSFNPNTNDILGLHPLIDHNRALTFTQLNRDSLLYPSLNMKSAARLSHMKLLEYGIDLSKPLLDFLETEQVRETFFELFKSDLQWEQIEKRARFLNNLVG